MSSLSLSKDPSSVFAGLLLANGVLLAPLPLELRLIGALALFVVLPGYLFVQAVFRGSSPGTLERLLLAIGCGCVLASMLMLALYALFRPLYTQHLLAAGNLLNAGLLCGALLRPSQSTGSSRLQLTRPGKAALGSVAILVLAAPFRLANLGYSEFQGDEAKVLLRTAALLQGMPDALIAHRKPPGEILLNAAFVGGLSAVTELSGRLPFALAGVVAVLAFYHLARVLFGEPAALVAGLLLGVNGYFVAFGRILQYQSVVLLLDTLVVLCLYRFARGSAARGGYALAGALLIAGSALMALSAAFLLPVAAVALWGCLFGPSRVSWRQLAAWLWPAALLLPSLLIVYTVLAEGPDTLELAQYSRYIGPRLGENRPYFHLESFLLSVNHYTSSPYLLLVLGSGALVLLRALYEAFRELAERQGWSRAGRWPSLAGLFIAPSRLARPVLFVVAVGLLFISTRRSLGWKLALIWLAGPLFAHLFLVGVPGTHWREVLPGLILLVAAAAAGLYARLAGRWRAAALLAGGLFLASSGHYVYVAWIQPWPEYQLLYPQYRHPLDWTDLERRSAGGTFGATRRHGWKVVGQLVTEGQLPADYMTNERQAEAAWYLKRTQVCPEEAGLVVRAPITPRDRLAVDRQERRPGYALGGQVYVAGRPSLTLLVREPPAGGSRVYQAEDYEWRFDRELTSPWAPIGSIYRPSIDLLPACLRNR